MSDLTVDPAADIPLSIGDTVQILSNHGGCPRCDAGLIAHTLAQGPIRVVPMHLAGSGCGADPAGARAVSEPKEGP